VSGVGRGDTVNFRGIDIVVHLAGHAHTPRPGPRDLLAFRADNVESARSFACDAARAGVKRFVLLSSASVFGSSGIGRPFRADDPINAQTPYARSKAEAERVVAATLAGQTEFVVVRAPMVYGPDAPGNFSRLVRLVARHWPLPFAGIQNRRSMVSVWNLCDFLVVASTHSHAFDVDSVGRPWLVSDGLDISTTQLVQSIAAALDVPVRLFYVPRALIAAVAATVGRAGELERLLGSFTLDLCETRERLNWQAPMPMSEAIARALRSA
jgi:nucleoside-diphosphate-sugar epimerase